MRRRDVPAAWFAITFAMLALVVASSLIDEPSTLLENTIVAVLACVPLGLYRFARSVVPGRSGVDVFTAALTVVLVVWTFAISFPEPDDEWSRAFAAYAATFILHWAVLLFVTAWLFARESRRTAGIARRRLRLFAFASVLLALALVLSGAPPTTDLGKALQVVIQLVGVGAAALFWFALAPPVMLRAWWRAREFGLLQVATTDLIGSTSTNDVRLRVVTMARRLTGARSALLVDDGVALASTLDEHAEAQRLADLLVASSEADGTGTAALDPHTGDGLLGVGRLAVVVGRATPFFGLEERRILEVLDGVGRLVEERAGVLERERDVIRQLRDVDELKNEFVAMVAHDLRSPMAVISGFADTMRLRWDDFDDERKLEFLGLISRNTRSLAQFVEDVLQVARIDSGALAYEVRPFDARAVVARVVAELRLTRPELGLEISVRDDVPAVLGDEDRHWQILTNLVGNAIKYTTAAQPHVRVDVSSLPGGREVAIAITDNGVGIAAEDQDRLFQRFSRVGADRREIEGTGLGLYIVKSMVEAQGGRIWVASEPGAGSTFTYTLPTATAGV